MTHENCEARISAHMTSREDDARKLTKRRARSSSLRSSIGGAGRLPGRQEKRS